jgi:uncharacterized DUF497 family protein
LSAAQRILVVSHTEREYNIRFISATPATRMKRKMVDET